MISIECQHCDAVKYDELDGEGLFWPPAGWEEVGPVDDAFAPGNYPDAWAAHMGWCPECVALGPEVGLYGRVRKE